MSPSYRITEPHPSAPSSYYIASGRGGAGNFTYVNPKNITDGQTATGPASVAKLPAPPSNGYFTSGRGGSGNLHHKKERAMFSFDEELAAQRRQMEHSAPVYHIGRGGAGNAIPNGSASTIDAEMKPRNTRTGSTSSTSSADSTHRNSIESAWHRVSRTFSRS